MNESSWDRPSGDGCVNQGVIYAPGFPEVDRVAAGSELSARIFKPQRPDSFEVVAYPKADKEGLPAGRARLLPVALERVVRDGRTVGWDAVFTVDRPDKILLPRDRRPLAGPAGLRVRPVRLLDLPRQDRQRLVGEPGKCTRVGACL